MKKLIKLLFLTLASLILLILTEEKAYAIHDANVTGQVYITIEDRKIPIPHVVLFKQETRDWDTTKGAFSVTAPSPGGSYGFLYNIATGPGVRHDCGAIGPENMRCAGINIGQNASEGVCYSQGDYHCGFACNPADQPDYGLSPQRMLAYFPTNFNHQENLPAGISFKENDMKGGGSWKAVGNTNNEVMNISPATTKWTFNAATFGAVAYNPGEWYLAHTNVNYGQVGGVDIEWLPSQSPSFRCTNLAPQPTDPRPGEQLTFTCTASVSNTSIDHYNFRVNEGLGNRVDTPESEASFSYIVPDDIGVYKVQCQVCISPDDSQCTTWGKAN